jgi:CHAT domain-containing protein/tetratricopeptide (TPR) repeat protein
MSNASELDRSDLDRLGIEDHLLVCGRCRQMSEQELILARISLHVQNKRTSPVSIDCPSEQKWHELVAGLHTPTEIHDHLEHAMHCVNCAALLRDTAEQFADEITAEEKEVLRELPSGDAVWQKNLARRMHDLSANDRTSRPRGKWWEHRSILLQMATVLTVPALLLSTVWWVRNVRPTSVVNRLLSQAYSEQRTLVVRMEGAGYAPVEALRGGEISRLRRPTPLLEAEVIIAKELSSKPDDPFWLDAQGRADLMDDNYSSALSALERAHSYSPESSDIGIDLASAYFLRGEELKRPEDYGRAVELLGQVLSKNPRNGLARFNRALSSERLFLYEQAMDDWRQFLKLDPDSKWSEEARKRLADLEEKTNLQKNIGERPLLDPSEFLGALQEKEGNSPEELDHRIEQYFDLALLEWVPQGFSKIQTSSAETARHASRGLAQLLISKHADYWLADFLEELESKPSSQMGLPFLTDSIKSSRTTDLDHTRKAALDAALWFRKSGNRAGELIALFESSYADQLSHEVTSCLAEAQERNDALVARRYPWLRTQFFLESAICTNLNDEHARDLASEAHALAKLHHFPSLELRAITFLASLYQYMGDTSSAWRYSSEGLARYWEGDYPLMRGYSLYAGLDVVAEETEQWFLDARIIQEASQLLSEDPDLELRAIEQLRLSNALAMTGDFAEAEKKLEQARALSVRSAGGARKDNLELEAQIALAKFELLRSEPAMVIHRLEPLRGKVSGLSDKDLVFDYFRNLGLAYFAVSAPLPAKQDLGEALALAEESLRRNNNERERTIWCRKAEPAYRAMAQLRLAGSPQDAFAQWEWFKGASLRGSPSRSRHSTEVNDSLASPGTPALSFVLPSDTAIVSYAFLPEGTFAWIYSQTVVRQQRLPISAQEVELLARRFADLCSRPDSNLATVKSESRVLYQKLFEPMEPLLSHYRHLVIEPDKALWLIPFEALLDANGSYLADRFAISLSPGLDYLAISPPWRGISQESRILIAADPPTSGRKPLEDAEEEAKGIARQFRYVQLMRKDDAGYQRIAEHMGDSDVFHFSGHAATSPDGVGLLLGDSSVMEASKVRASQFSGLKLAVLSACNSANGATGIFDDRDSLARLLVGAGVLEVVASRWMVNSRATSALMEEFYAQMLSGKDVSFSLRDASRKLRDRGEYTHPFYWAGFSAFGKS